MNIIPEMILGTIDYQAQKISVIQTKVSFKSADDQDIVHKFGNEIIRGTKAFSGNITAPNIANINLSNITDTAKDMISYITLPDYSAAVSINHDLSSSYTCAYRGYYVVYIDKSQANISPAIKINNIVINATVWVNQYDNCYGFVLCDEGDEITVETPVVTRQVQTYIPLKGVNYNA